MPELCFVLFTCYFILFRLICVTIHLVQINSKCCQYILFMLKKKKEKKTKTKQTLIVKKDKEGKTIEIIIFNKAKRFNLTDKNLISVKYYIVNFDVVIEYKMLWISKPSIFFQVFLVEVILITFIFASVCVKLV